MKFVSLHGHSSFSYGDGHGLPVDHVNRVKELGMSAISLTEHGNTSSHVQLEKAANSAGVKPIFGVEAYVADDFERRKFHQTMLAMNEAGYRNLSHFVTESWENFHYFPTVNESILDPAKTEGIIVLSGCADSFLSCVLAGGKSLGDPLTEDEINSMSEAELEFRLAWAEGIVNEFVKVYGDRYYLEVQPFYNYFRTRFLNRCLVELMHRTGVPLVGTADVHYPTKDGWEVQRLANAVQWNSTVEELAENRDYEASLCTFPESDEEYLDWLRKTGLSVEQSQEALDNSAKVAERCNVVLPKTPPVRFSESDGTDEEALRLLRQSIAEGIGFRRTRLATRPGFARSWMSSDPRASLTTS